jgi:hypothetical protein
VKDVYESWETKGFESINRSYLFSLEPIGIGTSWIESLTSYISRLAEAHCIETGTLVSKAIAPVLGKNYIIKMSSRGGTGFYKSTAAINGIGDMASDFVKALEALTLQSNLKQLTMLSFTEFLSTQNLLHSVKSWCPVCFQEWKYESKKIYEPLIWSIQALTVCPKHLVTLSIECPYHDCKHTSLWLTRSSRPGYCSKCKRWLGRDKKHDVVTDWEIWKARQIEQIYLLVQRKQISFSKEKLSKFLKICVEYYSNGNITGFSRILKIPKVTFWSWYSGENIPSLESLLKVSYCTQVDLISLFADEIKVKRSVREGLWEENVKKKQRIRFDYERARAFLEEIISDDVALPISMEKVGEILGCSKRTLYKHFPDLCKEISKRFLDYKAICKENRILSLHKEITQVVNALRKKGVYPGRKEVEKYLSKPGLLKELELRSYWKSLIKQI